MVTATGTQIKITNIGDEKGTVTVLFPSGSIEEYEIDRALALILSKVE